MFNDKRGNKMGVDTAVGPVLRPSQFEAWANRHWLDVAIGAVLMQNRPAEEKALRESGNDYCCDAFRRIRAETNRRIAAINNAYSAFVPDVEVVLGNDSVTE